MSDVTREDRAAIAAAMKRITEASGHPQPNIKREENWTGADLKVVWWIWTRPDGDFNREPIYVHDRPTLDIAVEEIELKYKAMREQVRKAVEEAAESAAVLDEVAHA